MIGNGNDADNREMNAADKASNYTTDTSDLDVLESAGQRAMMPFDQRSYKAYSTLNKKIDNRGHHLFNTAIKGFKGKRDKLFAHRQRLVGTSVLNNTAIEALKKQKEAFEELQFGETRVVQVGFSLVLLSPSQSGKKSGPAECEYIFNNTDAEV